MSARDVGDRGGFAPAATSRRGHSAEQVPLVPDDELARRIPSTAGAANPRRGWERLYVDPVLQADTGADLDFLVGSSGSAVGRGSH
jgi:hypothetical protein